MVSLRSNLLRAVAENTALVISVMEFGAVRADAAAHPQKEFCSNQHAQSRSQEIDPKGMPGQARATGRTTVSLCKLANSLPQKRVFRP